MFSAHLVFGDINNHSNIPNEKRHIILGKFWDICEKHKPQDLNNISFYETDNDSFMAGFSSQEGYYLGYDVLNLVGILADDFEKNQISVSFGINLIACLKDIAWQTYPGFINDLKMIHMPDEMFNKIGKIQRSRLDGVALIVTARLQNLAKKLNVLGCVSTFNKGHIENLDGYELKNGNIIKSKDVSKKFHLLGPTQSEWLADKSIKAFSIELE